MQAFNDQANPPPLHVHAVFNGKEELQPAKALRVLVACEFSGTVPDAFLEKGHDAWSCDLLPVEHNSNRHIQDDVRNILDDGWDFLIVAHPPCVRLCNSGVRWLHKPPAGKTLDQMWMMCAWSVMRSSSALHSRAFGITCVHSENGKLVVWMTAAFSAIQQNFSAGVMGRSGPPRFMKIDLSDRLNQPQPKRNPFSWQLRLRSGGR